MADFAEMEFQAPGGARVKWWVIGVGAIGGILLFLLIGRGKSAPGDLSGGTPELGMSAGALTNLVNDTVGNLNEQWGASQAELLAQIGAQNETIAALTSQIESHLRGAGTEVNEIEISGYRTGGLQPREPGTGAPFVGPVVPPEVESPWYMRFPAIPGVEFGQNPGQVIWNTLSNAPGEVSLNIVGSGYTLGQAQPLRGGGEVITYPLNQQETVPSPATWKPGTGQATIALHGLEVI